MIKDVAYAFVAIALTIWFEVVVLGLEKPPNADSMQVFKVQGDLWVAAAAVILGAYFAAADDTKRGKLGGSFLVLLVSFILIVTPSFLAGQNYKWVNSMGNLLSIWIPNAIAAVAMLICIHLARGAGE